MEQKKIKGEEAKERTYFPFFFAYVEALDDLEDEKTELELYRAISHYGTYGKEPELTGLAKTLWRLIKPGLSNSRKQFENGSKGGAPKGNKNARSKKHTPPNSLQEVRNYCNDNGIDVDCERFFDYWEGKNWKWRNPAVKTWQDGVRKWAEMAENYR